MNVKTAIATMTALCATTGAWPAGAQSYDPAAVDAQAAQAAQTPLDAATMHAALDGYGQWVHEPTYGDVWVPAASSVGADFVPYGTQGQWLQTDAGWYWQSELPWGWVTFHYGRWVRFVESWAWVPDVNFAPAWVDWRTSPDGLVGWAPLAPSGAPPVANYVYCPGELLGTAGFWSSVYYGPSAAVYYPRTYAMPARVGGYATGPVYPANRAMVPMGRVWWNDVRRGWSGNAQRAAPVYAQPSYGAPVYATPNYGSPRYGTPVYGTPNYGAPRAGAPVYAAPVYAAPTYRPQYNAPQVYRPPVFNAPAMRPQGGWHPGGFGGGRGGFGGFGGGGFGGGHGGFGHGGRR